MPNHKQNQATLKQHKTIGNSTIIGTTVRPRYNCIMMYLRYMIVLTLVSSMISLALPSDQRKIAKGSKKNPPSTTKNTNLNLVSSDDGDDDDDDEEPSMVGVSNSGWNSEWTEIPDSGFKGSEIIHLKHGPPSSTYPLTYDWYRTTAELSELSCQLIVYDTSKVKISCDKKEQYKGAKWEFHYDQYTSRNEGHFEDSSGLHYYVNLLMNRQKIHTVKLGKVTTLPLQITAMYYCNKKDACASRGYPRVMITNETPYDAPLYEHVDGVNVYEYEYVWYRGHHSGGVRCDWDYITEGIASGEIWTGPSRGLCLVKQIGASLTVPDGGGDYGGTRLRCTAYKSSGTSYSVFSIIMDGDRCCVRSSHQLKECP